MPTTNTQSHKGASARYVIAGSTGGSGRIVDRATARTVLDAKETNNTGVVRRKIRRRGRKMAMEMQKPEKKLDGAGFWIIVGLAAVKDITDIILAATLIFAIIASFMGIIITFVIFLYLFYNGVKITTKKLTTIIITFIIEIVPFLGIIPTATISLFIVKKLENNEQMRKFTEKKAMLLSKM